MAILPIFILIGLLFTGRIFLSGYARQEASVLQASLTSVFVQFSPPREL